MKIHVEPDYGWGWRDDAGAVDVPPPFDLDATITIAGHPFREVVGRVDAAGHPLSSKWIRLSMRTGPTDGICTCNLSVFSERPTTFHAKSSINGYAHVRVADLA